MSSFAHLSDATLAAFARVASGNVPLDATLSDAELAAFARMSANALDHKVIGQSRLVLPSDNAVVDTTERLNPTGLGSFTSGESGLPCGPDTYVRDASHDDNHLLIGRGINRHFGVTRRDELIALQGGGKLKAAMRNAKQ